MNLLNWLNGLLSNNGSGKANMDTSEDIYSADDEMRWWNEVGIAQWLVLEDNEDEDDELREDN
jgi:hypothetical protein